jgi:hypothetical protein
VSRGEALVERNVLRSIGADPGLAIYKNEVGKGFTGNVWHLVEKILRGHELVAMRDLLNRSRITYGLGNGSPDLAGSLDGRAFYLELKDEAGRVSPDQEQWHRAARAKSAFVGVVRSPEEAIAAMARCRAGGVS